MSTAQTGGASDSPMEVPRMTGCLRLGWGLLTLAALVWIGYGLLVTASVTGEQLSTTTAQGSEAYQAGTVLGGSLGLAFFLCSGLPFAILFGLLYWRNGVAIREVKKHNQMIDAMRRRSSGS